MSELPSGTHTPDRWALIEIVEEENKPVRKILAGWEDIDKWRISSAVNKINIDLTKDHITAETSNGSTYILYTEQQGLKNSTIAIYNQLRQMYGEDVNLVTL